MPRDNERLVDMLTAAKGMSSRVQAASRDRFDADQDLQIIVTHLIEMIGEAARNVSSQFRTAHADIPWTDIIGMRHRLIHDYSNIDLEQVWGTAVEDILALIALITPLIPPQEPVA
jgi:uncharacterized protein with HEPN domain